MNPDTLKQLGDEAASRKLSPMEVHAHAAAWEAQAEELVTANNKVVELSGRLEAARGIAEATLKRWKSRPWETTDNAERRMKDILASLAGEKP